MKRLIALPLLLSLWSTNHAFAQMAVTDSVVQNLSERTYTYGAKTAERMLRALLSHRAHLGIWPIEADDLRAFVQSSASMIASNSWGPCRLTGEADGCMISVLISPGQPASYNLADTLRIRRADIRLYVTAEPESANRLRAEITGELRSGELLTLDGRLIELRPYNAAPRYFVMASQAADSILYIR